MIEDNLDPSTKEFNIFKKKPYLNIQLLQSRSQHIQKNKLSDIFGVRDVEFYDLYQRKKYAEEVDRLNEKQFPFEVGVEELYNDIEVNNLPALLNDRITIEEIYGESIKVEFTVNFDSETMDRRVLEDPKKVKSEKMHYNIDNNTNKEVKENINYEKDPVLLDLDKSLKNLEKEFGKTKEEIADIFVKVSGRLNKMRDYLEGKPVIEWNYLEDLALTKNEESPEFQVLLNTKGL